MWKYTPFSDKQPILKDTSTLNHGEWHFHHTPILSLGLVFSWNPKTWRFPKSWAWFWPQKIIIIIIIIIIIHQVMTHHGVPWLRFGLPQCPRAALEVAEMSCTSANCSATAGLVSPPAQHSPANPWGGHGLKPKGRDFKAQRYGMTCFGPKIFPHTS